MNRTTPASAMLAAVLLLLNCERQREYLVAGPTYEKRMIRFGGVVLSYDERGNVAGIDSVKSVILDSARTVLNIRSHRFFYNGNNLRVREDVREVYPDSHVNEYQYQYEYDANGFQSRVHGLNRWEDGLYHPAFEWLVTCDSLGRPTDISFLWSDGTLQPYHQFDWDERGNIREERFDFRNGRATTVTTYEYDRSRNPFSVLKGVMEVFKSYNRNNPVHISWTSEFPVPSNGESFFTYSYDGSGYPLVCKSLGDDGTVHETKYEYEPIP